jgi:4-azaleucine resistance transporter AzlC
MEIAYAQKKRSPFRQGMQASISIVLGYMPIALTFGLLAKTTGLTLVETVLMSAIVYAGASQYICLNLLALGTGMFEIVLTTFIVNIRHFLLSASLNERMEKDKIWKKIMYAFGITDETFSVAATKEGTVSTAYWLGIIIPAYGSWVIHSALGYVLGASLPQNLQESMSIALYAMFIGLLVPALKVNKKAIWLAVFAALFHSLFALVFKFSTGWAIVSATLLSAFMVEWMMKGERTDG